MRSVCEVLPENLDLLKQLQVPSGVSVTPAKKDIAEVCDLKQSDLIRCKTCHSYLNKYCEESENGWICSVCMNQNQKEETQAYTHQRSTENIEVILSDSESLGNKVIMYNSLSMTEEQLSSVKL